MTSWLVPDVFRDSSHLTMRSAPSRDTSTVGLLARIRYARRIPGATMSVLPEPATSEMALDDEAAHDEELYIAGTASERDALILNTLTAYETQAGTSATTGFPGLRTRVVSANVSFVFYKTAPYGLEASTSAWSQVEALVGSHEASVIVQRCAIRRSKTLIQVS
jgi:hypothetical protein